MTRIRKERPIIRALRYSGVFVVQLCINPWYGYFLVVGVILLGGALQAHDRWTWIAITGYSGFVGWVSVVSAISRVDRAIQSLPLSISPEYGFPRWIVRGKSPLRQNTLEVTAAGLSAKDFNDHLEKLSSRLCEPIRDIKKPDPTRSVILIELGRAQIPERVTFSDLPWSNLKTGQFFVGQSTKKLIVLDLAEMIHLLVAGQTGMGKTAFTRQLTATVLSHTRHSHALVLDMKGGIDFHAFKDLPCFELATEPEAIVMALRQARKLVDLRKKYLAKTGKEHWNQLSLKELENEPSFDGHPVGPVLLIVDELAELVFQMPDRKQANELQKILSTFPRMSRSVSVHLIAGTQRPDKRILDGQSKDNIPTQICFSVPSVQSSTLVVGDKSASTLGNHRGRAVYRQSESEIVQTPLFDRSEIAQLLEPLAERLKLQRYNRKIRSIDISEQEAASPSDSQKTSEEAGKIV